MMTRGIGESIDRLFEAFGATNAGKRSVIYRERLRGYSAQQVSDAVERLIDRWGRTTAPPFNVLLNACREIADEDRRRLRDAVTIRERGQRMNPRELQHCRMIADLYDAGFDFDDVQRKWVNADECAHMSPDAPGYQPLRYEATEAAHRALKAGTLVGGSERTKRFRARGLGKAMRFHEPGAKDVGEAVSKVADEQAECF